MRAGFRLAAAAVLMGVCVGWAPPAVADDLTDQRDQINTKINQARADIEHSSAALVAAVQRLEQSQAQLQSARAELAAAQAELAGARAKDAEAASALASATLRAEVGAAAVARGAEAIAAQRTLIGEVARSDYQQNTTLVGISTLFTAEKTGQLNDRLQWTTTLADTTSATITRLEDLQAELAAARTNQAVLEAQTKAVRDAAASRLTATQQAEARAKKAETEVGAAVKANTAAKAAADQAVAVDKAEYEALQQEVVAVNQRIAERAAAQRAAAEAARKAAEAAQAEAARQAAAANKSAPQPPTASTGSSALIFPVNAPVTSSYGMRLHPVLGYWKLHDGTDFGAGCGTPIRAAASGVVSEAYFNGGYGNRLFIDHGVVGGAVMTTSYNHMSGYAVSVGQRVSQGQVIGYVGTTGYSTGCHLHLMLWVNGSMVNPMNYF